MASSDNISMAVFCDFENVALGVRDANYEKFDIKPVLERLLLKGSITVKKSYCDWERYKSFKAGMHEANFELIEIPHVRQSGKNSADIRLVVDALDLCYTKSHVNTFVIISGDSDFSPLVSKLRENNKQVIGVGVKQSTSDLLVANCDEFIFYDDLVREQRRAAAKRDERKAQPQAKRPPSDENNRRKEELEARKTQALEMVAETFDALVSERGDTGKIWASLLKDTLKRRRPDFSESYYGFRTFGNLLEEAQTRGLFEFGRDEKSGTYVFRSSGGPAAAAVMEHHAAPEAGSPEAGEEAQAQAEARPEGKGEAGRGRGRGRGGRNQGGARAEQEHPQEQQVELAPEAGEEMQAQPEARPEGKGEARRGRGRGGRNQGGPRGGQEQPQEQQPELASEADDEMQPPMMETRPEGNGEARRGRGRGGRKQGGARAEPKGELERWQEQIHEMEHASQDEVAAQAEEDEAPEAEAPPAAKERRRAPRKTAAQKLAEAAHAAEMDEAPRARAARQQAEPAAAEPVGEAAEAEVAVAKPARKRAAKASQAAQAAPERSAAPRSRRPAKPKSTPDNG